MSNSRNESDIFSEESSERPERRRTVWIWVIFVWTVLSAFIDVLLIGLMSYHTISSQLGVPAPQIGIVIKLVIEMVVIVIDLAAAWALLMLRSRAITLFAIGLVISIVTTAHSLAMIPNYLSSMRAIGWIWWLVGIGFVTSTIFLLYAMQLRRRGVLL
ncbi:MAG: hypothetical protein L0Y67_03865 [Gammaproteobacteria bacterium]|nr:hypothetical protein [Gammaproteobacteria bacterium]